MPTAPATGRMVRRGQSGASGELLSPEQQRRIDTYMQNRLQELDCFLPYNKLFSTAQQEHLFENYGIMGHISFRNDQERIASPIQISELASAC